MTDKKWYLFDMDGTLVDSMGFYSEAMLTILRRAGITPPEGFIKTTTTLGYRGAAEAMVSLGVNQSVEEIVEDIRALLQDAYTYRIPAKDGVLDYLTQLKTRGISLAVLTASPHSATDVCLQRNGVFDLFEHVWSTEDFGMTKAQPEIFLAAAARLGCQPEEVLFFDDNYNALCTAKQANMTVIGVYDASSQAYTQDIKAIADGYLDTFAGARI